MSADSKRDAAPIIIKKYANRRLYNTATSSYVTLDHLSRLIQEGVEFVVHDAKSGDDITRSVLTQIIVEEESKGENLLPISFLRQLISFYGDNMRWMVPQYLEHMFQNFSENQDRMRGAMEDAMGNMFPFGNLEEMRKQNMAFFEQAMRVWSPFAAQMTPTGNSNPAPKPAPAPADSAEIARLQSELKALREREAAAAAPAAPAPSSDFTTAAPPPAAANEVVAKPAPAAPAAATPKPATSATAPAKAPRRAPAAKAKAPAAKAKPAAAPRRSTASKTAGTASPKPRAARATTARKAPAPAPAKPEPSSSDGEASD
ncbi:MAG: polyhydroxyalkanoate synthesis repressor PhaR [Pseudomonadota bacterium]